MSLRAPRPWWIALLGGIAGMIVGFVWLQLGRHVMDAIDDSGPRLPWPLAIIALVTISGLVWAPWIPLFRRVGLPWWFALVAGLVPLACIAIPAITLSRLATGTAAPASSAPTPG
jgi:hypothetical protein